MVDEHVAVFQGHLWDEMEKERQELNKAVVSGDDPRRIPSPTVHQGRSALHVSWTDIERYGPTDLCPTSTSTMEKVRY